MYQYLLFWILELVVDYERKIIIKHFEQETKMHKFVFHEIISYFTPTAV
jgi:hypothetical protein